MYQKLIIIIVIGLSVNVEAINLRGKVTNLTGDAVPGAVVTLVKQNMVATTDVDGNFTLSDIPTNVFMSLPQDCKKRITLNKGVMEFQLLQPSSVKVEIFSAKGRLLKSVFLQNVSVGSYRLNITEIYQAVSMLFIRASIGSMQVSFSYLPINNGKYSTWLSDANHHSTIRKNEMALPITDTLRVTARGYIANALSFFSNDTTVNISLKSKSDIAGNWRLERTGCFDEEWDSCNAGGVRPCPFFYCFSNNKLTRYATNFDVFCYSTGGCDTIMSCYDTTDFGFYTLNDTTYQCWGYPIRLAFINDTLELKILWQTITPKSSAMYYLVKETLPVPYCPWACTRLN